MGLLYAHKLVQVVPGFVGSKISPSGCGVLYLAGSPSYFSEIAIFHGFACFIYFDFDAAIVAYCERGGWCKSCHIQMLFLWVIVIRLLIVRGLPAIPFQLLRGSVRKCSNVGGSRHNIGIQSR